MQTPTLSRDLLATLSPQERRVGVQGSGGEGSPVVHLLQSSICCYTEAEKQAHMRLVEVIGLFQAGFGWSSIGWVRG